MPAVSLKAWQEMVLSDETSAETPEEACRDAGTSFPTGRVAPTEESPSPVLMTMATSVAGRALMWVARRATEVSVETMNFMLMVFEWLVIGDR